MTSFLNKKNFVSQWVSIVKSLILTGVCVAGFFLSGCIRVGSDRADYEINTTEYSEQKAVVSRSQQDIVPDSIQKLVVENRNGRILITGVDENFGWNWELKCRARDEMEANSYADQCRIEADNNNGIYHLKLITPKIQRRHTPSISSELTIRVPKSIAADAKNMFGGVEITLIKGTVKVHNQSGPVSLKSLPGEINASTSFNILSAEDIGPAQLNNQSGGIKVKRVSGDLNAETSFNVLHIESVKGTVKVKNQSGAIQAVHIEGEIEAKTSFSRLQIRETGPAKLSNQSGFIEAVQVSGNLIATTSFATIKAEKIQGRADLSNQSGAITAMEIDGPVKAHTSFAKINLSTQSPTIEARNQSGNIEIKALSAETTRIDASTSFNLIQLWLPQSMKPLITAETSFGKVQSDFPVIMKGTMTEKQAAEDASPTKVVLKNQSGDIRIGKNPEKN